MHQWTIVLHRSAESQATSYVDIKPHSRR